MRIAFIAPFGLQPKGTVSARMVPLAQALARHGHMVRIVVPPWDDLSTERRKAHISSLAAGGQAPSVQIVTLPLPRRMPTSLALTYGLVRWALRPPSWGNRGVDLFKPQLVHVFKPIGYSGLAGLVLSAMRVPWVLDVDDWEGPGGWADVNPYKPLEKLSIALMEMWLPRLASSVTAASRTLEARAWDMGLPRRRVRYMPNGAWQGRYATWPGESATAERAREAIKARYGLNAGPVLLLYTRFAEFPYRWTLEILKRVLEDHPDTRLLVVGSGFFGEEKKLLHEAKAMGIAERVVVVGHVPEIDLPAYLSVGDVALYPMRDDLINRAKSSVKLLDQMVLGLAVVAHSVGQTTEFLGEAGVLVPPGDVRAMSEAASMLLSDQAKRARLGKAARERAWTKFNWEELSKVAEQAYREILAA